MLEEADKEECEYYFNEEDAENIVKFFTYLKHSKGVLAGQSIILEGLSLFVTYNLYGFKYKETDYRLFNKAFISMSRKGQKSQLQSGYALYEMSVLATKFNSMNECYCAGVTRKQSGVIFEECKLMLRGSILAPKFKITRDKILHIKSGSFLEALSKEAKKSGEGTNPSLGIIDEFKDHPDLGFYEILETGMKAQPQPLLIMISTAGNDISCPMRTQEYPYAERVLNGDLDNINYFTVILEVENGDDISDYRIWEKANQLLFTYNVGIKGLKDSFVIAKEIPEKMTTFLVKNLNMWQDTKGKNSYMNMAKFKACKVEKAPDIKGKSVFLGFDLSAKIDTTSWFATVPIFDDYKEPKYYIKQQSYIPNEDKLKERIVTDKQPYDSWLRADYLRVTKTPIVNHKKVIDDAIEWCKDNELTIEVLLFDPANASMAMTYASELDGGKYNVGELFQSYKQLNDVTTSLREQAYCGNLMYTEDPMMEWHFSNAIVKENDGLIKIDKGASKNRIDIVDAGICSVKEAFYYKPKINWDEKIASGSLLF